MADLNNLKAVANKAAGKSEVKKPATTKKKEVKKPVVAEKPVEKKPVEKKEVEKKEDTNNFTAQEFADRLNSIATDGIVYRVEGTKISPDAYFLYANYNAGDNVRVYKVAFIQNRNHHISLDESVTDGELMPTSHCGGKICKHLYSIGYLDAIEDAVAIAVDAYIKYVAELANADKDSKPEITKKFTEARYKNTESIIRAIGLLKDDPRMSGKLCNGTDDKPKDYQYLKLWLNEK